MKTQIREQAGAEENELVEMNRSFLRKANLGASKTWGAGGSKYDRISAQIADAIEHGVDRLALKPQEEVLDVATGTGWAARLAASQGARVTATDFAPEVLAAAVELGNSSLIRYAVEDAEALSFEDGSFDAVLSTFGVMFCGEPERAARELVRVCRPGGRVVLVNWQPCGGVRAMFEVIRKYLPTPPVPKPSPFEWGKEERLQELFGESLELETESGVSVYRDVSAEAAWEAFSEGYGPVVSLVGGLEAGRLEEFRREFIEYHRQFETAEGIVVERPYVVMVGRKG